MNTEELVLHRSLAASILPSSHVVGMYTASWDMTREKAIHCLRMLVLSHERLRAEFDGLETMYRAVEAKSE